MKKGLVTERAAIAIMVFVGLLGVLVKLESAGLLEPPIQQVSSGITSFAAGDFGTQEEAFGAPAPNQPPACGGKGPGVPRRHAADHGSGRALHRP